MMTQSSLSALKNDHSTGDNGCSLQEKVENIGDQKVYHSIAVSIDLIYIISAINIAVVSIV